MLFWVLKCSVEGNTAISSHETMWKKEALMSHSVGKCKPMHLGQNTAACS